MGEDWAPDTLPLEFPDEWTELATKAVNDGVVQVDTASEARPESDTDPGAEAEVGRALSTLHERVARFSHVVRLDRPQDDPFWLPHFWNIVEALDTVDHMFTQNNFRKKLAVVSGCSGMCAEGWALKLMGMFVDSINCCDLKNLSHDVIAANFEGQVSHFFHTVADQVAGEGCYYQHDCGAPVNCCEDTAPDLGCIGTPCQPFSRQRTKRHHPGSVQAHKDYNATFKDLLDWLVHFEPKAGFAEQVEGFELPDLKTSASKVTPLDRLLEMLENCTWGHGGYHVLPVHMDATAWLNMSRPRIYIIFVRKDCGDKDTIKAIARTIQDITQLRAEFPPNTWMDLLLPPGDQLDQEMKHYLNWMRVGNTDKEETHGRLKQWERDSLSWRDKLGVSPNYAPWTGQAGFTAVPGLNLTPRIKDLMDCVVIDRMRSKGQNFSDTKAEMRDVFLDVSQSHVRKCFTMNTVNKCLTTSSVLYSFGAGRIVLPKEMQWFQGYPKSVRMPSTVSPSDLRTFVGEGMFLPSVATVLYSLILHVPMMDSDLAECNFNASSGNRPPKASKMRTE